MSLNIVLSYEEKVCAEWCIKYHDAKLSTCNELFKDSVNPFDRITDRFYELTEEERENPVERSDPSILYVLSEKTKDDNGCALFYCRGNIYVCNSATSSFSSIKFEIPISNEEEFLTNLRYASINFEEHRNDLEVIGW